MPFTIVADLSLLLLERVLRVAPRFARPVAIVVAAFLTTFAVSALWEGSTATATATAVELVDIMLTNNRTIWRVEIVVNFNLSSAIVAFFRALFQVAISSLVIIVRVLTFMVICFTTIHVWCFCACLSYAYVWLTDG